MLTELENSILNELDKQSVKSNVIAVIMNKLDDDNKKNKFLSYLINKRNELITSHELLYELTHITK